MNAGIDPDLNGANVIDAVLSGIIMPKTLKPYKHPYFARSYVKELLDDEIKEILALRKQTEFTKGYAFGLKFARNLLKSPNEDTKRN